MNKFHIPHDLISLDGESQLHEKVNKDTTFSQYLQNMLGIMDENIKDKKLKDHLAEACQLVYIFAEIAAYKEGFHEGIRFLANSLVSGEVSGELHKRDQDFAAAFKEFLTEYKLDRIADIHGFLEENEAYRKLNANKSESEKALQQSAADQGITDALLNYMTSVDHLVDEVQSIFYEHGFQDSITIAKRCKRV